MLTAIFPSLIPSHTPGSSLFPILLRLNHPLLPQDMDLLQLGDHALADIKQFELLDEDLTAPVLTM